MSVSFLAAGTGEPPTTTNNAFFNGTSFNSNTNLSLDSIFASAYNGSVWVVGGISYSSGVDYIYYSTDGINWSPATTATPLFTHVYGIYWTGSKFIAVGANYNDTGPNFGTMAYSTDGIIWNTTGFVKNPSDTNDGFISITHNGSIYVATGYAGTGLYYSTDSFTWTKTGVGIFDDWSYSSVLSVATDGTKFVAIATYSNNSMAYSLDGITWTSLGAPIVIQNWNAGIAHGNGLWMVVGGGAVGTNGFATSTDGINWTVSNTAPYLLAGTSGSAYCVHYDGSRFLIGLSVPNGNPTRNSTIYATTDGVNFTEITFSQMPTYVFTITSTYVVNSGGGGGGGGGGGESTFVSASSIPQKLIYDQTVQVALDNNEINLADSSNYGHRVVVEVPVADLNGETEWTRSVGSLYPVGTLKATFTDKLLTALGTSYFDLDSQADGLSFTSATLDDSADLRLRIVPGTNSVNDWVVAYVLYKLYGKSSFETASEVFNIEDVQNMLENVTVTTAISSSLSSNTASVQKLFRNLLVSDPKRYFDASGIQLPGLFETNPAAEPTTGSWQLTENDVIEIRLEFEFGEAITRRNVANSQLNTFTGGGSMAATQEIAAGEKFYIRLQVKAA